MSETSEAFTRTFDVRVEFFSDCESFAVDRFTIEISPWQNPIAVALARADRSIYQDERVPDLSRTIQIDPLEPEGPDPPPPAGGAVRPLCPRCGSDDIVRDATARWDIDAQCWSLSGTFDNETCEACEAEGDDFARWVPIEPVELRGKPLVAEPMVRPGSFREACLSRLLAPGFEADASLEQSGTGDAC